LCLVEIPINNVFYLSNLPELSILELSGNQIIDFSPLIAINDLQINWNYIDIPKKYWQTPEQWQAHWLVEEPNAELRRLLIQVIGYEKICQQLKAQQLDTWREYCLLKIPIEQQDEEDIYLLKMTCPSTGYTHVIRVPPESQSCREAIEWINWSINPQDFAIET